MLPHQVLARMAWPEQQPEAAATKHAPCNTFLASASRCALVLAGAIFMAACGGGGGGNDPRPPEPGPGPGPTGGGSPPTVSVASVDQPVNPGDVVTLRGSGSDPDGDQLSYSWSQSGTDNRVSLSNAGTAQPTFTVPDVDEDTDLTFVLTVTANGQTATANVTVAVNAPSRARARASEQRADFASTVTLDGSDSADPDDGAVGYSWRQVGDDGVQVTLQNADTATPTFTAPSVTADTVLTFELTFTDADGATSTTTVQVVVLRTQPPTADAGTATPSSATPGVVVTLRGSGSDPQNGSISFLWQQTKGEPRVVLDDAGAAVATFTAPDVTQATTFTFVLRVLSESGLAADDEVSVTIHPSGTDIEEPPSRTDDEDPVRVGDDLTADAGDALTVNAGAPVTLRGSGEDPQDRQLAYSWSQTGTEDRVTLSDDEAQAPTFIAPPVTARTTLTFELTVTAVSPTGSPAGDDTATDQVTVTVLAVPPVASAAVGAVNQTEATVNAGEMVTLQGSGTDPQGRSPITYSWQQVTSVTGVELSSRTTQNPTFTAPSVTARTTITFALTVTAGGQASTNTARVTITVNAPPIASATVGAANQTEATVNAGEMVTLQGSGTDPQGRSPITYSWQQVTSVTGVELSSRTAQNPTFTAPPVTARTTITFALTVTAGGQASTNTAQVTITVNAPPIASATVGAVNQTEATVNAGEMVTLQGSGTDPQGRAPITYSWQQITSVTGAELSSRTAQNPTFTAPPVTARTTITFALTITAGGQASTNTAQVTITVNPLLTASAEAWADVGSGEQAVTHVNPGTTVTLRGSGNDPQGRTPLTYSWRQIDPATGTALSNPTVALSAGNVAAPTFAAPEITGTNPTPLTLAFELTVTAGGDTATASVTVTVNAPPTGSGSAWAVVGSGAPEMVTTVNAGATVTLRGSGSDPQGQPLSSYSWSQTGLSARPQDRVDLPNGLPSDPDRTLTVPTTITERTTLTFELTVTAESGLTANAPVMIIVNALPTADAEARAVVGSGDPQAVTAVNANVAVILQGSGSSDPQSRSLTYSWEQIDPATGAVMSSPTVALSANNVAAPTFTTPTAPALTTRTTFAFKLTVTATDAPPLAGDPTSTANVSVTVHAPPTAIAGARAIVDGRNQVDTYVNPNLAVTLRAAGSDPQSRGLVYTWNQVEGTPMVSLGSGANPTFTAPGVSVATTLVFELTVTAADMTNTGGDLTGTARVSIRINAPPTASVGLDQSVAVGSTVTLEGSGTDPEGEALSYSWQQTSGPDVSLSDADTAMATFPATVEIAGAALEFTLTARDPHGLEATSETVRVTVQTQSLGFYFHAGHGGTVRGVAINGAGTRALTGGSDGMLRFWNVRANTQLWAVDHGSPIYAVALSGDGSVAMSASFNTSVRVWSATDTQATERLFGASSDQPLNRASTPHGQIAIFDVALNTDGSRAATAGFDGTVRYWDTTVGGGEILFGTMGDERLFSNRTEDGRSIYSVSLGTDASDNVLVLTGDADGNVRLLEIAEVEVSGGANYDGVTTPWSVNVGGAVHGVSLNGDGTRALTGGADNTVRLWDTTMADTQVWQGSHEGDVSGVHLSGDGTRAMSVGEGGVVRLWNADNGTVLRELHRHLGYAYGVALNDDGTRAVSGGFDDTMRLWDLSSLPTSDAARPTATGIVLSVAPDILDEGTQTVTDTVTTTFPNSREIVVTATLGDGTARAEAVEVEVSVDADGATETDDFTAVSDFTLTIAAGATTATDTFTLTVASDSNNEDDETILVTGAATLDSAAVASTATIAIAGTRTPSDLHATILKAPGQDTAHGTDTVRSLSLSADGTRALSSADDDTMRLWNMQTGEMLWQQKHEGDIAGISMSADARRAISATKGADGRARLWDLTSNPPMPRYALVPTGLHANRDYKDVSMNADGTRVATASNEAYAHLWDATLGGDNLGALLGSYAHDPDESVNSGTPEPKNLSLSDSGEILGVSFDVTNKSFDRSRAFDTTMAERTLAWRTYSHGNYRDIAVSGDGEYGAIVTSGHTVIFQKRGLGITAGAGDTGYWYYGHRSDFNAWMNAVSVSEEGRLLLAGGYGPGLHLIEGATSEQSTNVGVTGAWLREMPQARNVWAATLSRDGRIALAGTEGGGLVLWKLGRKPHFDATTEAEVPALTAAPPATNAPPTALAVARAEGDSGSHVVSAVNPGVVVTLQGGGSSSNSPNQILTDYAWSQATADDPQVSLSSISDADRTFTAPTVTAETVLTFTLTVTALDRDGDDNALTGNTTVRVTINAPPTASAEARVDSVSQAVTTVNAGVVVTLQGGGSSDPQSRGLAYAWEQVAAPNQTLDATNTVTLSADDVAAPTFTAPALTETTELAFTLTVTANDPMGIGGSRTATTNVSITVNAPPVAMAVARTEVGSLNPEITTARPGAVVTLDGSGSRDPQSRGLAYAWEQTTSVTGIELSSTTLEAPTFTAPTITAPITVTFELTVTADDPTNTGGTLTATTTLSLAINTPPTADAGPDQDATQGSTVTLQGRGEDAEGRPLSYSWRQIGATEESAVTLTTTATPGEVTFTVPTMVVKDASLTFELTVTETDAGGLHTTDEMFVTVTDGAVELASIGGADGPGSLRGVSISDNGSLAVSGGVDGTVRLWDVAAGAEVKFDPGARSLGSHDGTVAAVAISGDGTRAISGGRDGKVRLWNTRTGTEITYGGDNRSLSDKGLWVYAVALNRDGSRAASGGFDGTVRYWDSINPAIANAGAEKLYGAPGEMRSLGSHTLTDDNDTPSDTTDDIVNPASVYALALSDTGHRLLSGGADGTVRLWNTATGTQLDELTDDDDMGPVYAVALSGDGNMAASGSADNNVHVWNIAGTDTSTYGELHEFAHGDQGHGKDVTGVSINAAKTRLLSAGGDGRVILWNVDGTDASNNGHVRTLRQHTDYVWSAALSDDDEHGIAVSAGADGVLNVWNTATAPTDTTEDFADPPAEPDVDPSALGDVTSTELLNAEGGNAHTSWLRDVAMSADGSRVMSASADKHIQIWDGATGDHLHEIDIHLLWPAVLSAALSADGKIGLSGDQADRLNSYNVETGERIATVGTHASEIWSVRLSADGRLAISGDNDGNVRLWDVTHTREILFDDGTGSTQSLGSHGANHEVEDVAFDASGRRALSGSGDPDAAATGGILRLWNTGDGSSVDLVDAAQTSGKVDYVALSADGGRALSGDANGIVRVWDADAGTLLRRMGDEDDGIGGLALSADGRLAMSGSQRIMRLWNVDAGTLLRTVRLEERVTAMAMRADGQLAASTYSNSGNFRVLRWNIGRSRSIAITPSSLTVEAQAASTVVFGSVATLTGTVGGGEAIAYSWRQTSGPAVSLSGADAATATFVPSAAAHAGATLTFVFTATDASGLTVTSDTVSITVDSQSLGFSAHGGFGGGVRGVAINGTGTRALTGGDDGMLRYWDVETSTQRWEENHGKPIYAVALSGDGNVAMSASFDATVRVWSVTDAGATERLFGTGSDRPLSRADDQYGQLAVFAVALNNDGTRAMTGGFDGTVRYWDTSASGGEELLFGIDSDQHLLGERTDAGRSTYGVVLSMRGSAVVAVTGDADGNVRLMTISNFLGRFGASRVVNVNLGAAIHGVSLNGSGTQILVGAADNTVRLLDGVSGAELWRGSHAVDVSGVAFSGDGMHAMSVGADGSVYVWDAVDGELESKLYPHQDHAYAVALNNNGTRAVSGGFDDSIRLWKLSSLPPSVSVPSDGIALSVAPDIVEEGTQTAIAITAAFGDDMTRTQDVEVVISVGAGSSSATGGDDFTAVSDFTLTIATAATAVTGTFTLTVASDSSNEDDETILIAGAATLDGAAVSPSPSATIVIAGTKYPSDMHPTFLKEPGEATGHSSRTSGVALSRDGTRALSSSYADDTMRLWNIQTGEMLWEHAHTGDLVSISMSADASRAVSATGGDSGEVRIWDLTSNPPALRTTLVPTGLNDARGYTSVSMNADGTRVATGSGEIYAGFWDVTVNDGNLLGSYRHNKNSVAAAHRVALSDSGEVLAVAYGERGVKAFDTSIAQDHENEPHHANAQLWQIARDTNQSGQFTFRDVAIDGDGYWGITATSADQLFSQYRGNRANDGVYHFYRIKQSENQINDLALTEEGRIMVSGDHDNKVRLWGFIRSGGFEISLSAIRDFKLSHNVRAATISRDGRFVLAGDDNGHVVLFRVGRGPHF